MGSFIIEIPDRFIICEISRKHKGGNLPVLFSDSQRLSGESPIQDSLNFSINLVLFYFNVDDLCG